VNEDEARAWLRDQLDVSRETMEQLDAFQAMVVEESTQQNLVSAATIPHIWARHVVDSAQLVPLAPAEGAWLDLGTGAGFPGMVVAILRSQPTILVESRRKRIDFLAASARKLGLDHAVAEGARLEALPTARMAVISARAFAPLDRLLALAHRFSGNETVWLLPKGKSAREELETVRKAWHGDFTVIPSVTDPDAAILQAQRVAPRKQARR
jgi:16S rRNA (guanine527-N7)-methyltransferase